jgi:hypothetical protein
MTDQNGTTYAYAYDTGGREISDTATVASGNPFNIDTSVTELGYSYNSQGLPYQQTSYDSSGDVVDQVVAQSRDSLGLETTNSAEFVSHGTVIDDTCITTRNALPWGRFAGGGQETLVPSAQTQIQLDAVTMPDDPLPWTLPTDPWPLPME